jgi:hypothetical protein
MIDFDDEEDALSAIKSSVNFFMKISDRLKNDKVFILKAMDLPYTEPLTLYTSLSKELRDDKEFLLEVIKRTPFAVFKASDRLKNDKEIAVSVFEISPSAFKYVSEEIHKQLIEIKKENIVQHLQYLIKKEAAEDLANELKTKDTVQKRIKI